MYGNSGLLLLLCNYREIVKSINIKHIQVACVNWLRGSDLSYLLLIGRARWRGHPQILITTKTAFQNPFDATLLAAVKGGVFVAQAAGSGGPFPKTLFSYSPRIASVAAAVDDRRYKNHLTLGNRKILAGLGFVT